MLLLRTLVSSCSVSPRNGNREAVCRLFTPHADQLCLYQKVEEGTASIPSPMLTTESSSVQMPVFDEVTIAPGIRQHARCLFVQLPVTRRASNCKLRSGSSATPKFSLRAVSLSGSGQNGECVHCDLSHRAGSVQLHFAQFGNLFWPTHD